MGKFDGISRDQKGDDGDNGTDNGRVVESTSGTGKCSVHQTSIHVDKGFTRFCSVCDKIIFSFCLLIRNLEIEKKVMSKKRRSSKYQQTIDDLITTYTLVRSPCAALM